MVDFIYLASKQSNNIPEFGVILHMPTEDNPVFIKQMHLAAGHFVHTHSHEYDHYGVLGSGVACVEIDGVNTLHNGPCVITIKANKQHKITAIENVTWFCIHASSETDESRIDETLIGGE